jgi:hypothetical protein
MIYVSGDESSPPIFCGSVTLCRSVLQFKYTSTSREIEAACAGFRLAVRIGRLTI